MEKEKDKPAESKPEESKDKPKGSGDKKDEIKHPLLRLILAGIFMAIAIAALSYGIMSLVNGEKGWQVIEATGGDGFTSAGDFVFRYYVGSDSARSERNSVAYRYSEAASNAFRIFCSDRAFDGVGNLY